MTVEQAEPQAPSCPKCGGAMWDNRASKRNPRAPDFKCKDKGCDGVVWPPREGAAPPAPGHDRGAASAAPAVAEGGAPRQWPAPAGTEDDPACPVCGGKMWDDRASKRNPRAPDFKCRNKPKVIGGPGCPGVIWPPREGEARRPSPAPAAPRGNGAAARLAAPPPPPTPPPNDADFPSDYDEDELPF